MKRANDRAGSSGLFTVEALEARRLLTAAKIMPLGDSITEGWNDSSRVTYRFWLLKQLQNSGYDIDFVGTKSGVFSGPPIYTDWDQDHQGTSGLRTDQIHDGVIDWAAATDPDVVLLLAGTNDVFEGVPVSSTIAELGGIIDDLRTVNANVSILLATLIPATDFVDEIIELNSEIPGVVADKDTPESPVILVDQVPGFDAAGDTWDGIHPNPRGERKMARQWFEGLSELLPAPAPPEPPAITYLSDLTWSSATNGLGPVELDQSNGDFEEDDGGALWLEGITYAKGLGTAANSEVVYDLDGQYARFLVDIGIDDAAGATGSAVFQVFLDDELVYDSMTLTGSSPTQSLDLEVAGKNLLKLVVTHGGDGNEFDRCDWANARLTTQPTVASSSFDFESAPHQIQFTFRSDVSQSLSASDLVVMNLTTATTIPEADIELSYDDQTNTATFTFPGLSGMILPDGNYRATIVAAGVTDAAGNPMPDDFLFDFFFLTADANHDHQVNLKDFNALAANFGLPDRYFSQGDFNYDGTVTLSDFKILASQFGTGAASGEGSPPESRARLLDELRLFLIGEELELQVP